MRIKMVQIGNSQGIRLPKTVIEQARLTTELALEVSGNAVVIRSARRPRDGWEQAAAACREVGADRLDDWDVTTTDFAGHWS